MNKLGFLVLLALFPALALGLNYSIAGSNISMVVKNGDCVTFTDSNATACWGLNPASSNVSLNYSGNFTAIDGAIVFAPAVKTYNQTVQCGFEQNVSLAEPNITILGMPKQNEVVQFRWADFGVSPLLNYSWADAGLTVLNAPMPVANCTNQTIYVNQTQVVVQNQTQIVIQNVSIPFCAKINLTKALNYSESYFDSERNSTFVAPTACVNMTINQTINQTVEVLKTVFPNLETDKTLSRGEVWSNASLGLRLQCEQQDKQVEKTIKVGENFAEKNVCYSSLQLSCAAAELILTPVPTPTAILITPMPLTSQAIAVQEKGVFEQLQEKWMLIGGLILGAGAILFFSRKNGKEENEQREV